MQEDVSSTSCKRCTWPPLHETHTVFWGQHHRLYGITLPPQESLTLRGKSPTACIRLWVETKGKRKAKKHMATASRISMSSVARTNTSESYLRGLVSNEPRYYQEAEETFLKPTWSKFGHVETPGCRLRHGHHRQQDKFLSGFEGSTLKIKTTQTFSNNHSPSSHTASSVATRHIYFKNFKYFGHKNAVLAAMCESCACSLAWGQSWETQPLNGLTQSGHIYELSFICKVYARTGFTANKHKPTL